MARKRSFGAFLLPLICVLCTGCPKPPPDEPAGTAAAGSAASTTGDAEVLLEPFDPPPLAELEAQVEWEEQPVLDAMELMRARKAKEPPLVSVAEALRIRNDSDEDNARILSALGQLPASDAEVDWDAAFHRHVPMDVSTTNPILGSSRTDFEVADLTSFGMFGFDWNFAPFAVKDHVVSWHTSQDRMYDKVVLRDDLTWSDGRPLTAHDVEFSFQAIMNPKVPAVAVRSGTSEIRWVEAYDDRTVVYFHKQPLATNVWNVNFPIIPRHVYEDSIKDDPSLTTSDYHIKRERKPVSGGSYVVTEWVQQQEIVLERREGRPVRRKPYFKTIRFRIIEDPNTALLALKNAEIDELELRAAQWTTQTGGDDFYQYNTKAKGVEWAHSYIGWNCKLAFFEDKRVRQAMSYALDHDEMIREICYGLYEPGRGIYHPTAWMAPAPMPEPYHQDLGKAEELLDAAGWTDSDGDGIRDKEIGGRKVPFEFTVLVASGSETGLQICTLLKENLAQIGVTCHVKPTEFTVMQDLNQKHEFQATYAAWGTGADPDTSDNLWTSKALRQGGRNYTQYTHPDVDRLYEEGKKEFDREKRGRIYARIHQILWEDQPYTWLYYRSSFFGFNKELRGYTFSPRGPYGYGPGLTAIWKPVQK